MAECIPRGRVSRPRRACNACLDEIEAYQFALWEKQFRLEIHKKQVQQAQAAAQGTTVKPARFINVLDCHDRESQLLTVLGWKDLANLVNLTKGAFIHVRDEIRDMKRWRDHQDATVDDEIYWSAQGACPHCDNECDSDGEGCGGCGYDGLCNW
jgi:hypothetical protein